MTEKPINPIQNSQNLDSGKNEKTERTVEEILNLIRDVNCTEKLGTKEANKLIEAGHGNFVVNNLGSFEGLNAEIANKLIEDGGGDSVVYNLGKFIGLNHVEIANKLIEAGKVDSVASNLGKFEGLNHVEIANKLIEAGHGNSVVYNLGKFEGLNAEIANKLIEDGGGYSVASNLGKFIGLNHVEIANKLIEAGHGNSVVNNLGSFEGLNAEIANKLIEDGGGYSVASNLGKYIGLNHVEIANKLIEAGHGNSVVYNLGKFIGLNHVEIVNKLIEAGDGKSVAEYLENFIGLNHIEITNKLIEAGDGKSVAEYLENFIGLNHIEIANKLIENGNGESVDEYLENFIGLDNETIKYLNTYIKKPDSEYLYKLRNQFSLQEIMDKYDSYRIKAWEQDNVLNIEDKETFEKLKTFIDEETLGNLWKNNIKNELHIIGPQIIRMYDLTKKSKDEDSDKDTFRGQFLERIIKDGSSYEINYNYNFDNIDWEDDALDLDNKSPLNYFNNIVENLNIDSHSVLTEANAFEQTRELAEGLIQENPFKSWETLKKYYELSEFLKNREVLEKLQKLKADGKDKQYKFFSDLAFHPGSKISMQAVFKFMEDPAHFLNVEDAHSGEAHERKKPSNYTRFNYLDISAEDLRDALIEGNLDKLQYFKPFEANYKIALKDYANEEILNSLKDALGSYKEKIQGNAKNPGKLFQVIQSVLKKYGMEYKDLSQKNNLTHQIKNELEEALFDNNFGIKDERKYNEYLVKIHPKSSPEGHLAGNDTACCMPFGSGKNNVYMYNLGCSILTVQRKVGDKYRTIAQSVLTPDVDIKHNISDLINNVQNETLLSNVIEEDLTQKKKIIITADNIEVAPNSDKYKEVIEKIYADFVSRYAHTIETDEIEKDRMLIGIGYNDLNFSRSTSIDNTFIPITPVAYSDNYRNIVYELPLLEKSEISPLPNYGMLQKTEQEIIDPDLPKGVKYLTAHDTLRVSYMEGKVYAENESLVQYIHRIGNELTAKDINNSFKGRPNLSFKVEDDSGAMLGYMIAYEGAKKNTNEKVIYISDLAADVIKSKLTGGRLIKAFKTLIKREYLDKGDLIPIIMEARESTSYQIIKSQLSDDSRKNPDKNYGYKFEIEENGVYESGNDTMHQIKLIPIKL